MTVYTRRTLCRVFPCAGVARGSVSDGRVGVPHAPVLRVGVFLVDGWPSLRRSKGWKNDCPLQPAGPILLSTRSNMPQHIRVRTPRK
jgi:hypothetical protein